MELPLLRLGLLGFSRAKANLATARVSAATSGRVRLRARWEIVPFDEADIWLIDSQSVSLGDDRGLGIVNPDAPDAPFTIYPHQSSRPVAFTQPLPGDIDAVLSIGLDDAYDCAQGLNAFSDALSELCRHFALGEQVASRQSGLVKETYHLHFEGRMVGMVDLAHWQVGLSPDAGPMELALASWRHRPNESQRFPQGFEVLSLERLMWVFASRTHSPSLPTSYLSSRIHLRRLSVLPQGWLHDDHMNLIGRLSQQPCTMATLARLTQLPYKRLNACLAALYYSGTITTDMRQIVRGDKRIHSMYSDADQAEPSSGHSEHERPSVQSVFDTRSFVPSRATI
jgi:hypothetical protein